MDGAGIEPASLGLQPSADVTRLAHRPYTYRLKFEGYEFVHLSGDVIVLILLKHILFYLDISNAATPSFAVVNYINLQLFV